MKKKWTIFIYLCGTDLESRMGSGTLDLSQICDTKNTDNVRFVIQTGGTAQWQNEIISTDETQRYVYEKGDLRLVDSVPAANMGEADTLKDFLSWGVSNYASEKMGVILWNHGCGSIYGVCVDELNEKDSLALYELNQAFSAVYSEMTDQFEFIGCDACVMSSAETANIFSTYARYMYCSQESEPGTGWDYSVIGNSLADNPALNGAELGKIVADSFRDECKKSDDENMCTLSIIDLHKFDDFLVEFNDYSRELYKASLDSTKLNSIARAANSADNFGGNNKTEGYTNMVDIGGIMRGCSDIADASKAQQALKNCIVYNINGLDHKNASGLSIYYPLMVEGSDELEIFSSIAINPYYLSIVDMIANGYSAEQYDNSVFFSDNGNWVNEDCVCRNFDTSYFEYADAQPEDDNSKLITFSSEPAVDENGVYGFTLDDNGYMYTSAVTAFLYCDLDDSSVLLGETNNIYADWEKGEFADEFDGYWLSLPNGQLLSTFVVDITDDYVIYTSPINLNGKRTNLRIRQNEKGTFIDGAWDGVGENSAVSRGITKIKKGDKIEVVYSTVDDVEITADPYEWKDGDDLIYSYLPAADYYYSFCIEDVYSNYFVTDFVTFNIDEKGDITFINE